MRLITEYRPDTGATRFTLIVSDDEMYAAKLESGDYSLLADCQRSGTISDKLLWLEHLARRIELTKEAGE